MEITTAIQDGVTVISLSGSIDSNTAPRAQEKIMPLVTDGCCLVLDLSGCSYISSAGLRVLLMLAKQMASKKGRWAFAGLSEEIKDVMEMTGFSSFLTTYADVPEAISNVTKNCQ